MDVKLLSIDETGMSVRSTNALHRVGVHTVGDMMAYDAEKLSKVRNLGAKSISEILEKIDYYNKACENASSVVSVGEKYDANSQAIINYLTVNEVKTDALNLLPARAYNYLIMNGYDMLSDVIFMTVEELMNIHGIDESSARDIEKSCKRYIRENIDRIAEFEEQLKENKFSVFDVLHDEKYRSYVLTYVKVNNIEVSKMGLSTRSFNKLTSSGYNSMMDMIFLTMKQIQSFEGLGSNSIKEISEVIRNYIVSNEERLKRYLMGDTNALITQETLIEMILNEYRNVGFGGLSLSEFAERFKVIVDIPHDELKKTLGTLVSEGVLEYVDYRCYKVYTRFSDYYTKCDIDERCKAIIKKRLSKLTLDELGKEFSVTRERVRQILNKGVKKVREQYIAETGYEFFDEDYYRYLYETYGFDYDECSAWFSVPQSVWTYLDMTGSKNGTRPLEEAIKDTNNLDAGMRLRIKNFINRNRLYIDGKWIEKSRHELEPVVIKKHCTDEVTFTQFADIYNEFLHDAEIPFDEKLYYTDDILPSRKNRLQESRFVLWKRGERFRYYDIDGQDYFELFDTLDLGSYKDVELSTVKFVEEYPELMDKYDIRDGYELHNLLKKVLANDNYGAYPELKFSKMPTIRFGTPDRDSALFDIMVENAPIGMNDLCELIHKEFGYDIKMIPNYILPIMDYYHNGVFMIDQKDMSAENRKALLNELTEVFYFFSEIKEIYKKLFPAADVDEVNSYTLKQMGLVVNSNYVIQNYDSAEGYFTDILTQDDITDVSVIKHRYAKLVIYHNAYLRLRTNLDIIEFEPDKLINIRKLEKSGITKQTIHDFCNAVYDFADEKQFFSIQSLKNDGFDNELFDYGFDNLFYGNLLLSDERFYRRRLLGTIVFCKEKKDITIKAFLEEIIHNRRRIDLYEFDTLLKERYGCSNYDIYDIVYKTRDTQVFYDSEFQKFYADQELYYREIDEMGVDVDG